MKAYLAIKFKEDFSNRELIGQISDALENGGIETVVLANNSKEWDAGELMAKAFEEIDGCDVLILEFSEKGVGLGIEAGYAKAKGKPIIVIAKESSDISSTLRGIADQIIFYENPSELMEKLKMTQIDGELEN